MPSDIDRRTKKGKQDYLDFLTKNDDKTILPKKYNEQITEDFLFPMIKKWKESLLVQKFINPSHVLKEVSCFWIDKLTSVYCKCRPDALYVQNNQAIIIDIKTCQDACFGASI